MVFLDANILLELALADRVRKDKVIHFLEDIGQASVSILTIHLLLHFGLKDKMNIDELTRLADSYEILGMNNEDYAWAKQNCLDNDFEDALQVACAVRSRAEVFVTLDKTLAQNYKKYIPIKLIT